MFKYIKKLSLECYNDFDKKTTHFSAERQERYNKYLPLIENSEIIKMCIIDTEHRNGLEVHIINDNAICLVYNLKSRKLVTPLALREGQLKRYNLYDKRLREKARVNQKNGFNNF